MTGHVVRVKHLIDGWKRWQARCTCGWRSDRGSRSVAEQHAADHAFDHQGRVEMGWAL